MAGPWGSAADDVDAQGAIYDRRLAGRLLRFLKPYKKEVVLSVLLLAVLSVLEVAGPYLTKVAIDTYVKPAAPGAAGAAAAAQAGTKLGWLARMLPHDTVNGLVFLAFAYVIVLTLAFGLRYFQTYTMSMVGQRAMQDLRLTIFRHLGTLSASYYDTRPVGRIPTRVTQDVAVLNELFAQGVVAVIGDIFLLIGIIGAMLWLDWKLALVTLTTVPLLMVATAVFRAKVRVSYRRVRTRLARLNGFLQEHLQGLDILKVFNVEAKETRKFDAANRDHYVAHVQNMFYYAVFFPTVELIGALGLALILWYGGLGILKGAVTFGVVVAFIQYVDRFYQPVRDLSEKYNVFQSAMVASERIFELLDTPPAVPVAAAPRALERLKGEVEFDHVWFAYKDEDYVLRDLSFRIRPGEKVALVGATGAGKTSIASLLTRFYEFQKGAIRVDGVDIRAIDEKSLRRQIGLVLQDVFLFAGTVRENIAFGARGRDPREVDRALDEVGGDRLRSRLPRGLEEDVGERGGYFSMGERQILAFARALHYDPSILILDEATSAVDIETERVIQAALRRLLQGRTSLVIAHRLSTILDADRILVMHKGELREQGTHAELLARGGIYKRLYELQYARQKTAEEFGASGDGDGARPRDAAARGDGAPENGDGSQRAFGETARSGGTEQ